MKLTASLVLVLACSVFRPLGAGASCRPPINPFAPLSILQTGTDESWRRQPPAPKPSAPLVLPPAQTVDLPNGLTLIVVEDHRSPVVTIDVAVPVGEANDPPG